LLMTAEPRPPWFEDERIEWILRKVLGWLPFLVGFFLLFSLGAGIMFAPIWVGVWFVLVPLLMSAWGAWLIHTT
jgi:hypothetical protein